MKIAIRANLSLLSKKVKFVKRNEMQNIEYKNTLIYRFCMFCMFSFICLYVTFIIFQELCTIKALLSPQGAYFFLKS